MTRGVRICFLCCVPVIVANFIPSEDYSFDKFIDDFSRNYQKGSDHYATRKEIFSRNLEIVLAHNADASKSWKRGINNFADLTVEEFQRRKGFNHAMAREYRRQFGAPLELATTNNHTLPTNVDWREKGVISPVKDQGSCGSCWAFSTIQTIESYVAIDTGLMFTLSPQHLVSCAPNPLKCGGSGACSGSISEVSFNYIQLSGITTEWLYPYQDYHREETYSSMSCTWNSSASPSKVTITGYKKLKSNDQDAVMAHLASVGPLVVNVQSNWKDYHSGVFDGCTNLTNIDIDHSVQLVGYGTDSKEGDYWLIRNSWDVTWGEAGYIRLKRTPIPTCGYDIAPADGTGCKADGVQALAPQLVCGTCGILFDTAYPIGAKLYKKAPTVIIM